MQSRLTPSRKRRRPARPATGWRDAVDGHCHRLDWLAELLQACGEPLEPRLVASTGYWLSGELRALKALLDNLAVQHAQEAAAKAKTQAFADFGHVGE